ncbi:NAD(P)-dependent oxidoreductase [Brachybacterium sp. GPGPB12]|uniref:NAD(P)-dependent oxidoreductase n=1 Tax=Brachybacterium sp. GPGPB12 TaxID=3023517 RepID=UPI0031346178
MRPRRRFSTYWSSVRRSGSPASTEPAPNASVTTAWWSRRPRRRPARSQSRRAHRRQEAVPESGGRPRRRHRRGFASNSCRIPRPLPGGSRMSGAWSGLRCLVTGGAGFGGRRLVDELISKGADVTVLDRRPGTRARPEVDYVVGDVRDDALVRTLLRTRRVDAVFHLAAEALVPYSVAHPAEVLDVNARGTYVMLEAWRQERPDARFVLASSGAYYGDTTSSEPLPESASPLPAPICTPHPRPPPTSRCRGTPRPMVSVRPCVAS